MNLNLPITVLRKEDGEAYFKILDGTPQYTFDIQKAGFDIKHLVVGGNDISKLHCLIIFFNYLYYIV